jgi:hypothetical protein
MIVGAWVQAFSAAGMIEASATRSPCTPITRNRGSTTAVGSLPMRHVPLEWKALVLVTAVLMFGALFATRHAARREKAS